MTAPREDLRDHLSAVIEAARELPKEDRAFLADNFLDELEKQYELVPRSLTSRRSEAGTHRSGVNVPAFGWWPLRTSLVLLLSLFLLPVLFVSLFVLVHPPFLFLAFILFFLFRFARPGMRHGGPWRYGPRRGSTPPPYL